MLKSGQMIRPWPKKQAALFMETNIESLMEL